MEDYLQSLAGSQVTECAIKKKAHERVMLELHLFKKGKRTVLTVEEYSEDPTCRWIDQRLVVLGHLASLMKDVVKTERVELELIAADDVHGNLQDSGSGYQWIAFTHIVLRWKDYKVFLGDVESDDVIATGFWPSEVPFVPSITVVLRTPSTPSAQVSTRRFINAEDGVSLRPPAKDFE
ncbi:hypothetical protein R1sor_024743 [Riccia sorocarpa]|uniref:Uncharacterized protein n=1 Tax=Riccia sorocarpa TaxID=122646 RepID=A0ABD3GUD0_9MARC